MIVRLLLLAVLSVLCGCKEIRLQTVDTHEQVLGRTQRVVPGGAADVRARLDGTHLVLETRRGCEVVAWEKVEITKVRESDEDLVEELVLLGMGAVPLGAGIGLIADAPNVYDDDRNSRLYNATGQTGAYAVGGVLTGLGGLIVGGVLTQLMRVAVAGEEVTTVEERRGDVLREDATCSGPAEPLRTAVVLDVGGERIGTRGTDEQGRLSLDLAEAIPPEVAERAVTVEVLVGGEVVGELDIEPILDRQAQMRRERDERTWETAAPERCRAAPPDDAAACAPLEVYLERFPDGAHAAEAREILAEHAEPDEAVIATEPDPETDGAIDRMRERREQVLDELCPRECARQCDDEPCRSDCEEACR